MPAPSRLTRIASCRLIGWFSSIAIAALISACGPVDQPMSERGPCITCHEADRGRSTVMDHRFGGFPTQCDMCHTEEGWTPVVYDHHLQTGCITCHSKDRQRPQLPDHLAKDFPDTCEQCHTMDAWKPSKAPHDKFPLVGKHALAPCSACHEGTAAPPTQCAACHQADRDKATAPNHKNTLFAGCEACHTPAGWRPATVVHNKFILNGAHGFVACDACHSKIPLPTTCVGCHDGDRSKAQNPDHMAAGHPTDCSRCHSTDSWATSQLLCNSCHGSANNDAPPTSINNQSATTDRGVGAHLAHLEQSPWHAPVQCADCHKVPTAINDPGHNDTALPAEVIFSARAKGGGATPTWDGTTCSNTYCHGGTLSGGKHTSPVWTQVDGTQSDCGSCHGNPPTANNHPNDPSCVNCHPDTVDEDNKIINAALHINGIVEVKNLTCYSCHGSATTNNAPPNGLNGEKDTTSRAVGAHQAHLVGANWHAPVKCEDCHLVPTNASEAGHRDTALPAEVTFSAFAKAGGSTPTWDGTKCSNSYCHGATLKGGKHVSPNWTQVDGTQTACDSCHGMPPLDTNHDALDTRCADCHTQTVDAQGNVIAAALHINGKVEVDVKCNNCHGGATNDAPPLGTNGETATNTRAVGAHQAHLKSSNWRAPVRCGDCHVEPANANDPGHKDTQLPAEVTFSTFAKTGGATPAWNGTRCTNVYCHGATSSGGKHTSPIWTQVDGSQVKCEGCHGMPPTQNGHTTSTACATCHPAVVNAAYTIIAPNLHINGKVEAIAAHPNGYDVGAIHAPDFYDNPSTCTNCHGANLNGGTSRSCAGSGCHDTNWQTNCTLCHGGSDNQTGAPPKAISGQTATSVAAVGQHTTHVTTTTTHAAYDCSMCHNKPTSVLTGGHLGPSPAEVFFSGLAAGTSYNFSTHTCSSSYCHGNGRSGSSGSAVWNGSLSGGCGACHPSSASGLSGEHNKHVNEKGMACAVCHSSVVDSNGLIIAPSKHVNGVREVSGLLISSWSNGTCTTSCHGSERW